MACVTADELKKVFPTESSAGDLKPFIDAAELLVNEELADSGLSSDRKRLITIYLAAHFACIALEKGGLVSKKIGDAQEVYQAFNSRNVQVLGLTATRYGQQAVLFDNTGTLGALSANPVKAQFKVMSTPRCAPIADYD
jgi:hypothetical protein